MKNFGDPNDRNSAKFELSPSGFAELPINKIFENIFYVEYLLTRHTSREIRIDFKNNFKFCPKIRRNTLEITQKKFIFKHSNFSNNSFHELNQSMTDQNLKILTCENAYRYKHLFSLRKYRPLNWMLKNNEKHS